MGSQIIKRNSKKSQKPRENASKEGLGRDRNRKRRGGLRRNGRNESVELEGATKGLKVVIDNNGIAKPGRRRDGRRVNLLVTCRRLSWLLFLCPAYEIEPYVLRTFCLDPFQGRMPRVLARQFAKGVLLLTWLLWGKQSARGGFEALAIVEAPRDLEALEGSGKWKHDMYDGEPRQRRSLRDRLAGDPTGATL